jgi:hypothetical protein
MTQKVAWAHSHGVVPPDFVMVAANQEQQAAHAESIAAAAPKKRCPHCHSDSNCKIGGGDSDAAEAKLAAKPAAPQGHSKSILLLAALRCQGNGGGGMYGQPIAVPFNANRATISLDLTGMAIVPAASIFTPWVFPPPVPPPRDLI